MFTTNEYKFQPKIEFDSEKVFGDKDIETVWFNLLEMADEEIIRDIEMTVWTRKKGKSGKAIGDVRGIVFHYKQDEIDEACDKIQRFKDSDKYALMGIELNLRLKSTMVSYED